MANWWRKLIAPLHEPPSLSRHLYLGFIITFAIAALLFLGAAITSSDQVFMATTWAYAASGVFLLAFVALEARASRRAWAEAPQPTFDLALVGDEPDVLVEKRSLLARLAFFALGGAFVLGAIGIALDSSTSPVWRLPFGVLCLGCGAYFASFAMSMLVVKRDLVAVRSNLRWRTAAWEEIGAIEPTHEGIVFELKDGRRLLAIVTSKTTLTFLPVRYDKHLLENLRSRLR
jgi:hypothetical protein